MAEIEEFEIDRDGYAAYLVSWYRLSLFYVPIVWLSWLKRWARRHADSCKYWLSGTTLRVEVGVYFLTRAAVPLDRVSAVILSQGPLMRRSGIWALTVRTPGTVQAPGTVVLRGLRDPEGVRDRILAARDELLMAIGWRRQRRDDETTGC